MIGFQRVEQYTIDFGNLELWHEHSEDFIAKRREDTRGKRNILGGFADVQGIPQPILFH